MNRIRFAVCLFGPWLVIGSAYAQGLSAPKPGEVYREFSRVMTGQDWRVTDPNATATGSPGNNPGTFLPNPRLSLTIDDLAGAVRAEALIDLWGGHPGTTNKRFRMNGNAWITIPELDTTPTDGQCFIQQVNPVVEIPIEHLLRGANVIEGTSGRQTCHSFNWGQWGWYSITIRVYYDASKPHATGSITSPTPGANVGENPTISVNASSPTGIQRVDVLAYFDGYDTDGDGHYAQYHESYHRNKADRQVMITHHVGTDTTPPFAVTWDTELVPDQPAGSIKLLARIQDGNGTWFVTDEIDGLTLDRPGTVRLFKPQGVPQKYWVRNGQTKSSRVTIPEHVDLGTAVSARFVVRSWNGIDGGAEAGQTHFVRVNGWTAPDFGENHGYSFDVIEMPISALQNGINTIRFNSQSTHHGVEALWPGPALIVRFAQEAPAICGDGNLDPGEQCDDGNNLDGDGCDAVCVPGVVELFSAPQPGEVYKEFSVFMTGRDWRVTDPRASAPGSPGNSPADFLPNPRLPLTVDDLAGAVRAEALIDMWGGHVGTTLKKFRLNDRPWIDLPELSNTPTDGQCYTQQLNMVREVPLEDLFEGTNIVEATSGRQTCYNFNWGQWGWYTLTLRVYYDTTRPHAAGRMVSPTTGAELGENPTLVVEVDDPASVERVEFLAYFDGYDPDGDGVYRDYQRAYHRGKTTLNANISHHIGTATAPPYSVVWDTEFVPNQAWRGIKLIARILDRNGVWSVTEEVVGLSLVREGFSVRLYPATDVPEKFWVRNGQTKSSRFTVPSTHSLTRARAARLLVRTWNGIDGGLAAGQNSFTRVNNWNSPRYGANHYYAFDAVDMPVSALRSGRNTVTFHSQSTHHGVEILWPGPAAVVRFAGSLAVCGDDILDAGELCDDGNLLDGDSCSSDCQSTSGCGDGTMAGDEQCDDGNRVAGDGCDGSCQLEVCGNGIVQTGEACDDGNDVQNDGCGNDCRVTCTGGVEARMWYADEDGDGFGNATRSVEACDAPAGYVADNSDCDDGNAEVFPGQPELCLDGLDNDCDGTADQDGVDPASWFADVDGDGYGDPATASLTCAAADGLVQNDADCDDTDPAVHPGASELCGDRVDNDCNAGTIDECPPGPVAQLEAGSVTVGGDPVSVRLAQRYVSPVVVCTVEYAANSIPVVARVSNVTEFGFDVRLVNPSGRPVAAERVSYLVVEEGVWTIDGVKIEAQRYLSTVTDEDRSWVGQARGYGQVYVAPVVLGQVMTENDPRWSVFWAQGSSRASPPSPTTLITGKTVCEDPVITRADELIGMIVIESGRGIIGGVDFEAAVGGATVLGVSNGPPFVYGFATPFASAPEVTVATTAGMRGFNGGWTQTHGNPSASPTQLFLSVDEDQLVDNERSRQAERVAYAAFATPMVYPAPGAGCTSDAECDDGDACNGAETCDAGSCLPGTPLVCDDGEYCNGLETCVAGSCQAGAAPSCDDGVECTVDSCDESADACLNVADDALCDNGLFCDGVETCDIDVGCSGGTPACPSGICDEELDVCEVSNDPQATLESGVVTVGADGVTVGLARSYVRPVVVCTVQYANNSLPVLARVGGVTGNSFDVRLVNPSGAPVVAERVSYLVVEEGVWVIDGVRIEAQRYLSTVTDEDQSWIGEARAYGHSYTAPVVVGQVMTENDPSWSVFWSYGGSRRSPPSSTQLHTGKTVCEDPNATRADETIGVIVFETTRGTIGGVAFEAALGSQTVAGLPNGAPFPYGFSRAFATAPQVGVTSVSGMRGMNGGWAQTHGQSMSTRTQLFVSVDEDQTLDAERSRTTERLSYIVFEQPVAYPK